MVITIAAVENNITEIESLKVIGVIDFIKAHGYFTSSLRIRPDNLHLFHISSMYLNIMAKKTTKKKEEMELEHEQAKEELHQAELEMGYKQDEKFEESED